MTPGLLILALAASAPAAGTQALSNGLVTASDETIRPGELVTGPGQLASAIVCFTDGTLEIAGNPTRVRRGDAAFEMAQARTVKNTGASDIHYAWVEFRGKGLPETWGATGLSPEFRAAVRKPVHARL